MDVHLFKFQLEDDFFDLDVIPIYFPVQWSDLFEECWANRKIKFTLEQIGKHSRLLLSQIIHYDLGQEALNGEKPWLYVLNTFDSRDMERFVSRWLLRKAEEVNVYLSDDEEDLIKKATLKIGKRLTKEEIEDKPSLVNAIAAHRYCSKKHTYEVNEDEKTTLAFNHVFNQGKHEAVSDNVEYMVQNRKESIMALCAYVVSFSYTKEIGGEGWYLQLTFSIRRWYPLDMHHFKFSLNKHSVYIKRKEDSSMHQLTLKMKRTQIEDENGEKKYQYSPYILEEETAQFLMGDVETVLKEYCLDPIQYFFGDLFIGVPYGGNATGGEHIIGAGVDLPSRRAFYQELLNEFPFFKGEAHPLYSDKNQWLEVGSFIHNLKTKKNDGAVEIEESKKKRDFARFSYRGGKQELKIAILLDGEEALQEIKSYISEKCANVCYESGGLRFQTHEKSPLTIHLDVVQKEGIDSVLEKDNEEAFQRKIEAVRGFIEEKCLASYDLVIIEILDYHNKKATRALDSKDALREAFLSKQLKTCFFHPRSVSGAAYPNAVSQTLFDAFRKLGIVDYITKQDVNLYQFDVFQFTSVRKNIHTGEFDKRSISVPVLSRMTKDDLSYYFFDEKKWYGINDKRLFAKLLDIKRKVIAQKDVSYSWDEMKKEVSQILKEIQSKAILTLPYSLHIDPSFGKAFLKDIASENPFHHILDANPQVDIVCSNDRFGIASCIMFDEKKIVRNKGMVKINSRTYYGIPSRGDNNQTPKMATKEAMPTESMIVPIPREFVIYSNNVDDDYKFSLACAIFNSHALSVTNSTHHKKTFLGQMIQELGVYLSI